jgi:hypothetical protein
MEQISPKLGGDSPFPSTSEIMNARIQKKYVERMQRTYDILQLFNPNLADEVFQNFKQKDDVETLSAIKIQKVFKGFLARKRYQDLLYAHYLEEEEKNLARERMRMEEGLIMIENMRLEENIKEKQFLVRQKEIERNWAATVIQRRFRQHTKPSAN